MYDPSNFGPVGQFAPPEAARLVCALKRGGDLYRQGVRFYLVQPGGVDAEPVWPTDAGWLLRRCWIRMKRHDAGTGRTHFGVAGLLAEGYVYRSVGASRRAAAARGEAVAS